MKRLCILIKLLLLLSICQSTSASFLDKLSGSGTGGFGSTEEGAVDEFLPQEQAFNLNAYVTDQNTVRFSWEMPNGYYLYKHTFAFTPVSEQTTILKTAIPAGIAKYDEYLGDYEIYHDVVDIPLQLNSNHPQTVLITAAYQGCASSGYCYPPMQQTFQFSFVDNSAVPVDASEIPSTPVQNDQAAAENLLFTDAGYLTVSLAFLGFGLLLAFTPCVLPMLPILSGIVVGQKNASKQYAFLLSMTYILAVALTYAIAGVLAGLAGASLQAYLQKPWIIVATALLFVALALALFDVYTLKLPTFIDNRLQALNQKTKGGTLVGVVIMGVISALVVSPCVTAPLVGALTYISQTGDATLGGIALFMLGLGMGLPLVAIVMLGNQFLPRQGQWMNRIKSLFGFMMLAVAILMLTRLLPNSVNLLLWAALSLAFAHFAGAFTGDWHYPRSVGKVVGIISFAIAIVLVHVVWQNHHQAQAVADADQTTQVSNHISVESIQDVETQLAQARKQGKPVMIDVTADWCLACQVMKRTILQQPDVKALLEAFVILELDVTKYTATQQETLQHLGVFAPPTFIFYHMNGSEAKEARIVSEVGKTSFIEKLSLVAQ